MITSPPRETYRCTTNNEEEDLQEEPLELPAFDAESAAVLYAEHLHACDAEGYQDNYLGVPLKVIVKQMPYGPTTKYEVELEYKPEFTSRQV